MTVSKDAPRGGAARAAALAEDDALALAGQLGSQLAAIHARGRVHGELSLDVVRRNADDRWVLDGPGKNVRGDEREDVFGFGRVLYHALTGAPPFEVPAEDVPPRFRPTVLRCLQRDPERRYGSIAEVLAALGLGSEAMAARALEQARKKRIAYVFATLALVVGVGSALAAWRPWARGGTRVAHTDAGVVDPAGDPSRRLARPVVAVASFDSTGLPAEQAWVARAFAELVADRLRESPRLEVARARLPREGLTTAARKSNIDLVVQGSVTAGADGKLQLQVRLLDVGGGALRLAEQADAVSADDVLARGLELAAAVRKGAEPAASGSNASPPPPAGTLPASGAALKNYAEGLLAADAGATPDAEAAFARSIAADTSFVPPRVALVELLVGAARPEDAGRAASAARPLAASAGEYWSLRVDAAAGATPEARLTALEQLREKFPREGSLAATLAGAYARAGRAEDCLKEGERALVQDPEAYAVRRELTACALLAGDAERAAKEAAAFAERAGATGDELVGDVALARGKYGSARTAYQRAAGGGARTASAKLALVELVGRGRCRIAATQARAIARDAAEDPAATRLAAEVWARAAWTCGDPWQAREAVAWLRQHDDEAGAEALDAWLNGARGGNGTYAKLLARAQDATLWPAGVLARGVRWAPVLMAARAEKQGAAALAALGATLPVDAYMPLGAPLLYEVAMLQIALGDAEAAVKSCAELRAALPDWVPGLYCQGRAAETAKQWSAAFQAYRAFLDKWVDAEAEHRLIVDVRRRLPRVIAEARKPPPPAPPAP